jgi:hypothetical protein
VIVGNGKNPVSRTNAFEVSYDGHTTVFDRLDNFGTSGRIPAFGGTYNDNIIDAWGDVDWSAGVGTPLALKKDFGVFSVAPIGVGKFLVTVQSKDPLTGNPKVLTEASITVTVSDDAVGDESKLPGYATASHIGTPGPNQFIVRTYNCSCTADERPFFFKVSGR